jgi:hypothetical protein
MTIHSISQSKLQLASNITLKHIINERKWKQNKLREEEI